MDVATLVIVSFFGSGTIAAVITGFAQYFVNRKDARVLPRVQSVPSLAPEIRDEIEQNEAWWLRSYHSLMLRSGAEIVGRIPGQEYTRTDRGFMKYERQPDRMALEGCICSDCAQVVEATKPLPQTITSISRGGVTLRALPPVRVQAQGGYVAPVTSSYSLPLWRD